MHQGGHPGRDLGSAALDLAVQMARAKAAEAYGGNIEADQVCHQVVADVL
jgi:hypothetical protein